jgi:glycosyltransferase involved in cell wall biosynthesis
MRSKKQDFGLKDRKIRVLVIAQYYPPDMGGAATRTYNAVKGLILNNAEVVIVAPFPHYPYGHVPREYKWKLLKIEYLENVKIIRTFILPLPSYKIAYRLMLFAIFAISSLFALPAVGEIDVIWAASPPVISALPAFVYKLVKRAPVVVNVDDLWPSDLYLYGLLEPRSMLAKLGEILAQRVYHKADAITVASPGYLLMLHKRYCIDSRKVEVVPIGVDTSKFRPCPPVSKVKKNFIIVYSGAFSVAYDFDQVLCAAKLLKNENVKFVLQGGGELLGYLKDKVKELNLKNVIVLNKQMSREEVAHFLCEADALIIPYSEKCFLHIPTKFYEYQAVGKPIIYIARGILALHPATRNSGLIVRPGDCIALAEAILHLKNDPQLAAKLSEAGRKYVEKAATIETIGKILLSFFNAVTLAHMHQIDSKEQNNNILEKLLNDLLQR